MREKLYTVKYKQSSVTSDPWEVIEELTAKELIEAKEVIKNGMPKYKEVP